MTLEHVLGRAAVVVFAGAVMFTSPSQAHQRHHHHLHHTSLTLAERGHRYAHTYAHANLTPGEPGHRTSHTNLTLTERRHRLSHAGLRLPERAHARRYARNTSTPAERARTRALNWREARERGETGLQVAAANASSRRQYAQQLQFYRVQRGQYEDELDRYRYHMTRYEYVPGHSSGWWRTRFDDASVDAFTRLSPPALIGREIDDRNGVLLGRIYSIDRLPDGRVERIQVALGNDRAAWIDPGEFRYDETDGIVFADMQADDLYDRSQRTDTYRRG